MSFKVGDETGTLTVIKDLGRFIKEGTKRPNHYYECQCTCGNVKVMSLSALKTAKTCGDYVKHRYDGAENEIGKKYNHLTIIAINKEKTDLEYEKGNSYGVFYDCECDCDNHTITTVAFRNLKNGHIKSCGCSKFNNSLVVEDLTGKVFGRLTVLGRDIERDKNLYNQGIKGHTHWLCKCSCGSDKITSVTGYQLKSGHTQSCGCYASEQIAKRNKKYSTKVNPIEHDINVYGDHIIRCYTDDMKHSFVVDEEDYEYIKKWYWNKSSPKGYWITNSKIDDKEYNNKSTLRLHQIIAELKYQEKFDFTKVVPDHLDRDVDNNCRRNILIKTNIHNTHNRSLSKANSSGKTGVSYDKHKKAWVAYITVEYESIYLGTYIEYEDAVKARIDAEIKYGFTCDDVYPEYDVQD